MTHNISEDELARIATRSLNPEEAPGIWTDAEIVKNEEDQAAWARGFIRYTNGDLTMEEFRSIHMGAQDISYVNPEHIAEIFFEEENWWRDEFAETGMNDRSSGSKVASSPVEVSYQGRGAGRSDNHLKPLKQRVSTINWTQLWRKPGQANRLWNGFASNGNVIIDRFDFPECCRHECGIGVRELACGSATEPDKSLVLQSSGISTL